MGLAHWDDVEEHRSAKGEMDAVWQRLGAAAGTAGVGVNRVRVAPGKQPTPPHSHGASEELYYVLAGGGLAWQDDVVHEVRPRDCVIHRPDEHEHTFIAGPEGLEVIVFGTRHPTELGWLPRSRAIRLGWPWVEGRDDDPVGRSRRRSARSSSASRQPRPDNILNVDEVELEPFRDRIVDGAARDRRAIGARRSPLGADHTRDDGGRAALPHRGRRDLRHPRGLGDPPSLAVAAPGGARRRARGARTAPRPPRRAAAGHRRLALVPRRRRRLHDADLRHPTTERHGLLTHGRTRSHWRGLGVIARVEPVPYWDGEVDDVGYVQAGARAVRRRGDRREDRRALPPTRLRLPVVRHLRRARLRVRLRPLRRAPEAERQG